MKRYCLRFLLVLVLLHQLPQLVRAQTVAPKPSSYMQIFYYGTKSFPGSAYMSFAPAFHNQTDIRLNEPDITRATSNSNLGKSDQLVEAKVSNGKDDPKNKVAEQEQQQSGLATIIKRQEERGQKMRTQLMISLNEAAAEGWEVVQMSSYGDGGLVYLLRRAK